MALDKKTIDLLVNIAKEAGDIAVESRKSANFKVSRKSDGSKVSSGDLLVDKFLQNNLTRILPNASIVCEESTLPDPSSISGLCWMIDPIDGTSNYCSGGSEFTINVALFNGDDLIFSIIHAPLYKGGKTGYSDETGNLVIESCDQGHLDSQEKDVIVTSTSINDGQIDKFVEKHLYYDKNSYIIKKISSSVKFFEILEGKSDFFLMLHRTSEWDMAAGHFLIRLAGGSIDEFSNDKSKLQNLQYFKKDFLNNDLIISSNYGKKIGFKL